MLSIWTSPKVCHFQIFSLRGSSKLRIFGKGLEISDNVIVSLCENIVANGESYYMNLID